jgi:hypothetical protein
MINDYRIFLEFLFPHHLIKNPAWRGVCDNGFEVFLTKFVFVKRNN